MNASYSLIRVVLSSIDTLFFWQIDLRMSNAPREGFRLLEEIEAVSVRLLSIALDSLDILRAWIDQCLGLSCHEQGRSSWRSACEGCMSPRQLMIKMSTRCPLDAPQSSNAFPCWPRGSPAVSTVHHFCPSDFFQHRSCAAANDHYTWDSPSSFYPPRYLIVQLSHSASICTAPIVGWCGDIHGRMLLLNGLQPFQMSSMAAHRMGGYANPSNIAPMLPKLLASFQVSRSCPRHTLVDSCSHPAGVCYRTGAGSQHR